MLNKEKIYKAAQFIEDQISQGVKKEVIIKQVMRSRKWNLSNPEIYQLFQILNQEEQVVA